MAHNDVPAGMRTHLPHDKTGSEAPKTSPSAQHPETGAVSGNAFATRAHVALLRALGWHLAASPRHDADHHAPLHCCCLIQDGRRDEAAFAYTGLTMPGDRDCPSLIAAKSHVQWFLNRIDEDHGLLLQNQPLFAFGGEGRQRMAVFGGWRFQRGAWAPFLLGPEGLGGVDRQRDLFASNTAPHHMVDICGHPTKTVMPHISGLVRAIEALNQPVADEIDGCAAPEVLGALRIAHHAAGWFTAQPSPAGAVKMPNFRHKNEPVVGQSNAKEQKTEPFDVFGTDEFRFRKIGADR